MSVLQSTCMDEIPALVRTSSRTTQLNELLRASPQELLGVTADAFNAIKLLGINTVFDLAASQVFAAAAKLVSAANDTTSPISRYGAPPSDLVKEDHVAGKSLQEIQFSPIKVLRGVPDASATDIALKLDVTNVRDLSLYPPYRAATKILNAVYFPTTTPLYDPEQPTDLIPKSGEYPIEKVQYTTLLLGDIKSPDNDKLVDVNGDKFKPLDLSKLATADAGFKVVAFGALLTFTQSWFAQGVTLGHLLHSITLAPGESTRIAVVDWSRKSRAGQTEVISETDALTSDTSHNRSISEVTSAVAREAQTGFSQSNNTSRSTQDATSTAMELSAPLGGLFGGPSGSFGSTSSEATAQSQSDSYSTTTGSRNVASNMLQNVNDRTHQNAHDSRNRRAAVVKEVSQSEHEEISTRVIANYNHMHALSVQYYEVVQVFRVEVKLKKVDKVIFIPVQLPDFNDDNVIRRFQGVLFRSALMLGAREALQALDSVEITPEPTTHFSAFTLPLQQFLKTALLTRTSLTASALRAANVKIANPIPGPNSNPTVPVAPTTSSGTGLASTTADPASPPSPPTAITPTSSITPRDFAVGIATSTGVVRLSEALSVVHQVNNHLWSPEQVARLSGVLSTPLLRSDSNSIFLPAEVLIEGGIVASGGVSMEIIFHSAQGNQITDVSPENPMRLSDTLSISLKGSHATSDISATLTLTANRNGVRFPIQLPAVNILKGTQTETVIVRVKAGGINANLKSHLTHNRMYYAQAVFRSLDSTQIGLLLSGYGTKLGDKLVPVAQIVEPTPIRYVANFLAFKANVPDNDKEWSKWLDDHDITVGSSIDDTVPLGSGAMHGEAILGRYNCAEKLDITRFWNWQDSPPPLLPSDIAAIQSGTRATPEDVKPGQLSAPIINITSPTSLPDPTGTAAVLAAIQNGNMFRDQSGLAATIGLTQAAIQATQQGASAAGQQAGTNMNSLLQANTERQKTAAAMITDLAKTAASMYTGGLAGGGGGGSGGGSSHSKDGAKINYFDKMKELSAGGSGSSGSGAPGGAAPVSGGGQSSGGSGLTGGATLGGEGYSQNPAALAATNGQSQPASDLLNAVIKHLGPALGESPESPPLTSRKAWPKLDETTVLSRVEALQKNPNLVNQGALGLCTAAAFFHHVIQRKPAEFTTFAKELYGSGMSFLGNMKISPGSDLRAADYGAIATRFPNMPPQTDWMLMCSIRDSENWFFDFEGSPDESFAEEAISTTAKELSEWYTKTGFWSSVSHETNLDANKIKAINKTNNNQIALWIRVSLLPGDNRTAGHMITVETPIVIDEANDKVSFDYWTWGQPILKLNTTFTSLKNNLFGYIVATA